MPIFFFLLGFGTAASVRESPMLSPCEWLDFVVSRIAASFPMYLVAALIGYVTVFIRCAEFGPFYLCPEMIQNGYGIFKYAPHLMPYYIVKQFFTGFCFAIRNTWFQKVMYRLMLLFPFVEMVSKRLRLHGLLAVLAVFLVGHQYVAFTRAAPDGSHMYKVSFWLQWFVIADLMWHVFKEGGRQEGRWVHWGRCTDLLSLCWLCWLVVAFFNVGNTIDAEKHLKTFELTNRHYHSLDVVVEHVATLPLLIWLYGLAVGEGYSARVLSSRILVLLAEHSYAVYLLHGPVAWIYWYATRGTRYDETWMLSHFLKPMPINVFLETPIVLVLTYLASWFLSEYVCSRMVKPLFAVVRWPIRKLAGKPRRGDGGALGEVLHALRQLTGQEVTADTVLEAVGMDSFSTAAFVALLQETYLPQASLLSPARMRGFRSVGALSKFLGTGAETQVAQEKKQQ